MPASSPRLRLSWLAVALLAITLVLAAVLPGSGAGASPWWWPGKPDPTPSCGATIYKASGAPWTCTFDDEFGGWSLDSSKWDVVRTSDHGYRIGSECFVDSGHNVSVFGGTLRLTARAETRPFTCTSPRGDYSTQYTSGSVTMVGSFAQTYGRFAVRASFPATTVAGLQSSLWMWPSDLPASGLRGEIDIAEEYSRFADRAVPTLHYAYDRSTTDPATGTNVVTNYNCTIAGINAFHEYAMEWTPTTITVLYDGQPCLVDNYVPSGASPFDQPYFLILTQALGIGNNQFVPATTPLPATTRIDWVRVWK